MPQPGKLVVFGTDIDFFACQHLFPAYGSAQGQIVAIITKEHLVKSKSKRTDGKKLSDFADLILDTGAPVGDSMVYINGLETPVSPGSTVGGIIIVNSIKAELAKLLTDAGQPPKVLTAAAIVGDGKAKSLFESAYDEHSQRMAALYTNVGKDK